MHHSRTSVLWLTLCTLRPDHLGTYGYKHNVSPAIDSVAANGVVFERAFTTAPWTRPSIGASVTGIYPRTLDMQEPSIRPSFRGLPDSVLTLAEALQTEGYYTIGITANPNTHSVFKFEKFFAHLTYVDVHKPLADSVVAGRFEELAATLGKNYAARYDMQIRYLDWAIDRLLRDIEAMGFNDVLVVITSDHGEAFGETHRGDRDHGLTVYNEVIRVPLIFRHPSLQPVKGRRSARVDLASVMPTVLDLLGIEYTPPRAGGHSLSDLVHDRSDEAPSPIVVSETCFENATKSALIVADWKLIATYETGEIRKNEPDALRYELFRIDRDLDEAHDLAAEDPDQVAKLSALLGQWQVSYDPQFQSEDLGEDVPDEVLKNLKSLGYIK
jgi:arylsulfatase A-like enzyme